MEEGGSYYYVSWLWKGWAEGLDEEGPLGLRRPGKVLHNSGAAVEASEEGA